MRGLADGDGRFCLRRHHRHDLVPVPGCLVAHPLVAEVVTDGRFPPGAEVMVRAGARTGDRMVVVDGKVVKNLAAQIPNPRTAVGLNKNGRWLTLMVVDGRQAGYSEGVTFPELARVRGQRQGAH